MDTSKHKSIPGKIINWVIAVLTGIIITLVANYIWNNYISVDEQILRMDGVYHHRKENGENHYLRFYESGTVISKHSSQPINSDWNSSFSKNQKLSDSGEYFLDKDQVSMQIADKRYTKELPSLLDIQTDKELQEFVTKANEKIANKKRQILIGYIAGNRLKLTVYLSTGDNYEANYNFIEISEFAF